MRPSPADQTGDANSSGSAGYSRALRWPALVVTRWGCERDDHVVRVRLRIQSRENRNACDSGRVRQHRWASSGGAENANRIVWRDRLAGARAIGIGRAGVDRADPRRSVGGDGRGTQLANDHAAEQDLQRQRIDRRQGDP